MTTPAVRSEMKAELDSVGYDTQPAVGPRFRIYHHRFPGAAAVMVNAGLTIAVSLLGDVLVKYY